MWKALTGEHVLTSLGLDVDREDLRALPAVREVPPVPADPAFSAIAAMTDLILAGALPDAASLHDGLRAAIAADRFAQESDRRRDDAPRWRLLRRRLLASLRDDGR
jgi:hypothetical protein